MAPFARNALPRVVRQGVEKTFGASLAQTGRGGRGVEARPPSGKRRGGRAGSAPGGYRAAAFSPAISLKTAGAPAVTWTVPSPAARRSVGACMRP